MTNPEADPTDDDHQSTGKEVAPNVERHFPLKDQDKSRTRVALILVEEESKFPQKLTRRPATLAPP